LGGLWAVRVGVDSAIKTVGATVLGGLWALEWAWHCTESIKTVGATVLGGLWALEWAWHSTETNLRCVKSSAQISAFNRTDGHG